MLIDCEAKDTRKTFLLFLCVNKTTMSTTELKSKIISEIESINDESVLNDIESLIELELMSNDIYFLSEEQLRSVKEGEVDYKAGRVISEEAFNKKIDKWLND